ncbi:MAG TPA: glycosyltransferase family 39 protein [bacterium]|nr:glycosyltransferase family 39 protein [bacterium]HQG46180.1 glycosyltransferase family 39 protein [bacterium]HQI49312.1 glycosyltransferase family 39 protein [bacterium]HQJ64271.1 glycosyltransferase family 39 protein [bacterium]
MRRLNGKKIREEYGAIGLIVLLGLILRAIGLGFGDPFRYHPDEMKLVYHAGNLLDYTHWSKETFFLLKGYPPLYAFVLAAAFGIYILGLMASGSATSLVAVKVYYYLHPFHFHMVGRWLSVLAGTATIIVVYAAGKRLYSRRTGLWAAAFWAVTFLPVKNAHFGTVDILLTLLTTLSFYYSIRILHEGRLRDYLGAAIFASLAVATKYNAGLIILLILAAHGLGANRRPRLAQTGMTEAESGRASSGAGSDWLGVWLDRRIWLAAAAALVTFLVACPLPLVDFHRFWQSLVGTAEFEQTGKLGSGGTFFSYFTGAHSPGYGFFYDNTFAASLGWGLTLLGVAGMLWMIWRRRREDLLILIFPVALYAVIGQMNYKAMRHLLPLVPFLLLIAAELLSCIAARPSGKRNRLIINSVIIGLAVLPQFVKTLRYDLALYQVDTRTRMKDVIEASVPAGSRIGMEEFTPPLLSARDLNLEIIRRSPDYRRIYEVYGLVPKMFAHGMQRTSEHDAQAYVIREGIEYIVLDSFTRARYEWPLSRQRYPDRVEQRERFYGWVRDHCELLQRIEPENQLQISPVIELYRVKVEKPES